MSILWVGGEDTSFPAGASVSVSTSAAAFRSGYGRCSVAQVSASALSKSLPFPGGAVTTAWITARFYVNAVGVSTRMFGVGVGSTGKGIFVGTDSSTAAKMALYKWDGSSQTSLGTEPGTSLGATGLHRLDIDVVGPMSAAVITVYLDGTQVISYSGDLSAIITNFDTVFISTTNSAVAWYFSEIAVADEDTRPFPGVASMALTGAGTTDSWTGVYSTINQTTLSDASPNFSNTNAQDQQFNITDLPSGSFVIKAVKIEARMALAAGAVTKVSCGYNSGGSVAFGTGAQKTLTSAYTTYEQLDSVNPVTGVAFVQSDMNALQLDLRSAT